MAPVWFAATPDSDYMFKALTDGTVSQMSGGKIPKLTAAQAAGLIGSWVIESGRSISNGGFKNFDVIEGGTGRGRGISQYTGVRRTPYDKVAREAQARGENINSAQWQLQYVVNEYLGKYDKYVGGNSLVGYRRDFDPAKMKANKFGDTPQGWARYFTGSAKEGFGYFRPGTPHQDRRNAAAAEVFAHYSAQQAPPPPPASAQPAPTSPAPQSNPLQILNNATQGIQDGAKKWLQKLGIKNTTSFNTDKIQRVMGLMAQSDMKADVGLAIFGSTKGSLPKAWKQWNKMSGSQKAAWRNLGSDLGISKAAFKAPQQLNALPRTLSFDPATIYKPQSYQPSPQRSVAENVATSREQVGYLPGLNDIAQAGIANMTHFKNKGRDYGNRTFGMSNSTVSSINNQAWGGSMDLGRTLGISGSAAGRAAAAGGNAYGGAAMNMNAANAWQTGFNIK